MDPIFAGLVSAYLLCVGFAILFFPSSRFGRWLISQMRLGYRLGWQGVMSEESYIRVFGCVLLIFALMFLGLAVFAPGH